MSSLQWLAETVCVVTTPNSGRPSSVRPATSEGRNLRQSLTLEMVGAPGTLLLLSGMLAPAVEELLLLAEPPPPVRTPVPAAQHHSSRRSRGVTELSTST